MDWLPIVHVWARMDRDMGKRTGKAAGDSYDLMDLSERKVYLAVDTEYEGNRTLTVQCAVQIGDTINIQVYRASDVPEPPDLNQILKKFKKMLREMGKQVIIRPVKQLPRDLSPAKILNDLLDPRERWATVDKSECPARKKKDRKQQLRKRVDVVLVGHFLPADLLRMFGKGYTEKLLAVGANRVVLHQMKRLGFTNQRQRTGPVVCDGIRWGEDIVPVYLDTFDTNLPFGKRKLADLCKTFLNIDKCEIAPDDLRNMLDYFKKTPEKAYEYAIRDVVLTLLLHEKMNQLDRQLLAQLELLTDDSHEIKRTNGRRGSDALQRFIEKSAAGSTSLAKQRQSQGASPDGHPEISRTKLIAHLQLGGAENLREHGRSEFGGQIGDVHGGLLFSRSGRQLYQEAPGQISDADLKSCYPSIIRIMNQYVGQPMLWEPGRSRRKLKDMVAQMLAHAAGPDAWIIKVTGDIPSNNNVLIPSTRNALTLDNVREKKKRGKAKHSDTDRDGKTAVYSKRVEAGIVSWATWLVIQALPSPLREEYENLTVDSVLYYPRRLVADTVQEFDQLITQYQSTEVNWVETMDHESNEKTRKEKPTEDNVALRVPLSPLVNRLLELREEARKKPDGDLLQKGFKDYANFLYGAMATPHFCTGNVVAANIITATGRAASFLLQLSLNGFQVITDGCTYRRDQIPAVPFAALLQSCPDYCRHRPEAGAFQAINPEQIPTTDREFTIWYREHVRRFFDVKGTEWEDLLEIHVLEHKTTGQDRKSCYDALCCDGSSNYVKLSLSGGKRVVLDFKARQYTETAKKDLEDWLVHAYATDTYTPGPLCVSEKLLSLNAARGRTKKVLREESKDSSTVRALFPLAFPAKSCCRYNIIKPSAFIFQTPAQERSFKKAIKKFQDRHGAGLEALALRRSSQGRHFGSFQWIARTLSELIEAGETNPVKRLNLNRQVQHHLLTDAMSVLEQKKNEYQRQFRESILLDSEQQEALDTGWFVGLLDLE